MRRRIIVLGMALVMLFSVTFFGAGRCVIYEPIPEPCPILAAHKANAIVELQEHAFELGERNFTRVNWDVVQGYVDDGIVDIILASNIDEVNEALAGTKENMGEVEMWDQMGLEWGFSECLSFALHVEITTQREFIGLFPWLNYGDYFDITVKAKNLIGKSIYHYTWAPHWNQEESHFLGMLWFQFGDYLGCPYPNTPFTAPNGGGQSFSRQYFEKDAIIETAFRTYPEWIWEMNELNTWFHWHMWWSNNRFFDFSANMNFILSMTQGVGYYGNFYFIPDKQVSFNSNITQMWA